jgi:hypothetical protein
MTDSFRPGIGFDPRVAVAEPIHDAGRYPHRQDEVKQIRSGDLGQGDSPQIKSPSDPREGLSTSHRFCAMPGGPILGAQPAWCRGLGRPPVNHLAPFSFHWLQPLRRRKRTTIQSHHNRMRLSYLRN